MGCERHCASSQELVETKLDKKLGLFPQEPQNDLHSVDIVWMNSKN
jgi:hypothetical protein